MKKEFLYIGIIFIFLSLLMHFDKWISMPLEHISNLSNAGAYGFGSLHPLIFTLILYVLIWVPRGVLKLINRKRK